MTVLTENEYKSLAASQIFPTAAYINGKAIATDTTFDTINPATGETLTAISVCGQDEVNLAVEKAKEAFESGIWSKCHPSERKQILIKLCKLIKRNQHELAVLESLESGKPIAEVETVDIPEAIHCIQWHAELIDKIYDQVAPTGDDVLAMVVREAIGVVAAVVPWNFPLLMVAWKLGPALASGNSLIIKPAQETSMATLRLAELATEAGIPDGVLNVVTGSGSMVGRALGIHPDIDMITFTGSTAVGKAFLKYSGESNLKEVVLECGGKNPCVVMDDADDLDVVAQHVTNGVFWNMGENCSSNSRLIVHSDIKQALLEKIQYRTQQWRTGDPLDPSNNLGAIISEKHFHKIMGYIEQAKQEGANLVAGGNAFEVKGAGYFIEPTIFDGVNSDMRIAREEIFGPVLAVIEVNSSDSAIKAANDTEYGLTASVFSSNIKSAHRMARAIRAGTVTVNCFGEGDISTPFGGYKQSGFGGRDNSVHAHDQYTQLKTIWVDISDQQVESLP